MRSNFRKSGQTYAGVGTVTKRHRHNRVAAKRAVERPVHQHGFLRSVAWDWEGGRADLERALMLNPGNAQAHRVVKASVAGDGSGEADRSKGGSTGTGAVMGTVEQSDSTHRSFTCRRVERRRVPPYQRSQEGGSKPCDHWATRGCSRSESFSGSPSAPAPGTGARSPHSRCFPTAPPAPRGSRTRRGTSSSLTPSRGWSGRLACTEVRRASSSTPRCCARPASRPSGPTACASTRRRRLSSWPTPVTTPSSRSR